MNDSSQAHLSTRRSFIKKSIVASVAVSSMTIFSGLVNAADESSSPSDTEFCSINLVGPCQKTEKWENGDVVGHQWLCQAECEPKPDGVGQVFPVECYYYINPDGTKSFYPYAPEGTDDPDGEIYCSVPILV